MKDSIDLCGNGETIAQLNPSTDLADEVPIEEDRCLSGKEGKRGGVDSGGGQEHRVVLAGHALVREDRLQRRHSDGHLED